MYDVAIIGLGPAGATAARLLDKRFRVAVIDKKRLNGEDGGFNKPCGGLLATDAQKALSRFNLTLPVGILVDPQIFAVRTIDLMTNITRHYQRFYINLDRHKFDLWLASLLPKRVDVFDDAVCTGIIKSEGGYEVAFVQNGEEKKVAAKVIVGADGAASIVRKTFFKARSIRQYTAIQQWFVDTHATPFYSSIFDASLTDCYAWSISKNGFFILGAALPIRGARAAFETLKQKLAGVGFLLGEPIKTEACLVCRPSSMRDFCCGADGVFLVGEAAGFISPTSLEGVSFAFESARALSEALNHNPDDPQKSYRKRTLKIRMRLLLKQLKSPFMYDPLLRTLVMKSGLQSITVMRDAISEPAQDV